MLPGGPVVKTALPIQGAWVWTLVRELRFLMPRSMAKKKIKKKENQNGKSERGKRKRTQAFTMNWTELKQSLISHASKVMLKILQARRQQYVNRELPVVQAGFRKSRGTRDQIANIHWIIKKARELQKNIYFCFIDYAKASTVCITTNCGKFGKT